MTDIKSNAKGWRRAAIRILIVIAVLAYWRVEKLEAFSTALLMSEHLFESYEIGGSARKVLNAIDVE